MLRQFSNIWVSSAEIKISDPISEMIYELTHIIVSNFKKISQYWIATASTGICSKCRCCLGMKKKDVGWRGVRENMIEKDPYWWHMVLVPSGCWFVKSSRVIRHVLVWYIYSNSDSIQCICYNYLWSGRMCQIDGDTGGKWFTLVVFLVMQQESGRKALKGEEPSGRHTVVWGDLGHSSVKEPFSPRREAEGGRPSLAPKKRLAFRMI